MTVISVICTMCGAAALSKGILRPLSTLAGESPLTTTSRSI